MSLGAHHIDAGPARMTARCGTDAAASHHSRPLPVRRGCRSAHDRVYSHMHTSAMTYSCGSSCFNVRIASWHDAMGISGAASPHGPLCFGMPEQDAGPHPARAHLLHDLMQRIQPVLSDARAWPRSAVSRFCPPRRISDRSDPAAAARFRASWRGWRHCSAAFSPL